MRSTLSISRQSRSSRTIIGILALLLCSPFTGIASQARSVGLQRAVLDFDGDNKTDFAVTRDTSGTYTWYLQQSLLGFAGQPWGSVGDQFVPADYDGDLKWDIAIYRPGNPSVFYILRSSTGALQTVPFGLVSDDPRCTQDFDGDGLADPTVTRRAGGLVTWYILRSMLGFTSQVFGSGDDATIRGDFDGDGKADVAVYRPTGGTPANTFFVLRSSDGGLQSATFGNFTTDFIVPADFDGDGTTDQSVWRNSTQGVFYANRSLLGFLAFPFGASGDIVPAHILQVR